MIAEDNAAARCHWHSLMDSVGSCAVCGLAGCGTCLVQEGGGYRCQECIRKRRQIVQPTPVQPLPVPIHPQQVPLVPQTIAAALPVAAPTKPPSVASLRRYFPRDVKFIVSLLVFLAGVMIPLLVTPVNSEPPTLGNRMQVGYAFWALFWGAPAAWRLGRKILSWIPSFGCAGIGIGFAVAWVVGWFYCLFGGGIYQFLKHWRSVTQRTAFQG